MSCALLALAAVLLTPAAGPQTQPQSRATFGSEAESPVPDLLTGLERASARPWPRVAMLWTSSRADPSLEGVARHDLIVVSPGWLGLRWKWQPIGTADGFTPDSLPVARQRIDAIRRLNRRIVVLCEVLFFEWPDNWLPDDHPWWLRKNGRREQFWPGTHRMNWYDAEFRRLIVARTQALKEAGVDGVFFDNLREEPEPWVALLKQVREQLGGDFLILANSGYAVGRHDFAAPLLNGFLYESGWSHGRTEWDDTITKMRSSETLLREPRISVIERFEDTGARAGWPGDRSRGSKPAPDAAARRWSLCLALVVGDFYYLFADNTSHHHDWYTEYDAKIGRPVSAGERINSHVWRRRFERALVVVNLPGAKEAHRVELPVEATDTLTGEKGRLFEIAAGEGRILQAR